MDVWASSTKDAESKVRGKVRRPWTRVIDRVKWLKAAGPGKKLRRGMGFGGPFLERKYRVWFHRRRRL